jgi:hypothetical protein
MGSDVESRCHDHLRSAYRCERLYPGPADTRET